MDISQLNRDVLDERKRKKLSKSGVRAGVKLAVHDTSSFARSKRSVTTNDDSRYAGSYSDGPENVTL